MNRFLFYLILINMLTNMVSITPRILIAGSASGTILSMVLAVVVGTALTYFIVTLFSHFPGLGLPEIMAAHTPKWLATPVILFLSLFWFFAGLTTLIIYTHIILRFLTPEMSYITVVLSFVVVVTYGVFMANKNILYMSEIIFILVVPFIAFVQLKGYFSSTLDWDYIRVALMQINHLPDYKAFTPSLFVTIGVANLAIFNRYFKKLKKPTGKSIALLVFFFSYILATTYFLPIGFGGFDSLNNVLYPWIMTSDSIKMKFGLIERIVFIFIGSFLAIGVLSLVIHWHTSIKLLSSVIYFKKFKWQDKNLTLPLYITIFWAVSMYIIKMSTAQGLFKSVEFFDDYILPVMLPSLIGSLLLARKGASSKWRESKK